jgi:hypothetical protein
VQELGVRTHALKAPTPAEENYDVSPTSQSIPNLFFETDGDEAYDSFLCLLAKDGAAGFGGHRCGGQKTPINGHA